MVGTVILLGLLTSLAAWVGIIYLFLHDPMLFFRIAFFLTVVLGAFISLRNHLSVIAPVIEDHP